MSATTVIKKSEVLKNKTQELEKLTKINDIDTLLENVKLLDNICSFKKCKTKISDFAITCKYCKALFCTTHGLPEIHGCGEAVRKDEKEKFLHPLIKVSKEKHEQSATKLSMKIRQKQLERRGNHGASKK